MLDKIGKKLVLASHNAGKLREIGALFEPFDLELVSAGELGFDAPEETETTFEGNALIKAKAASSASGLPAIADDSGLSVDVLGGDPGVYTADWAETPTGRDFSMAMRKVWSLVEKSGTAPPWRARFVSVLCMAFPDGSDASFRGEVEGQVTWPMRGERGFGFDPMFVPDGHDETFGEMDPDLKHRISHRARSFAALSAALLNGHGG